VNYRFLSLFTGMGLMDMGLEAAGWSCVGQCEINAWRRHWLQYLYGDMPRWADVRDVGAAGEPIPDVDWICGGFPCQDASYAGKGAGLDGEKTGLWWEMFRVVRLVRPRGVIAENVPGLRARGLDRVLGSLEGIGYACRFYNLGAESVGSPHRRRRLFIIGSLADTNENRQQRPRNVKKQQRNDTTRGGGKKLADAWCQRLQGDGQDWPAEGATGRGGRAVVPVRGCPARNDYRRWLGVLRDRPELAPAPPQSSLCGVADGLPPRVVGRLRREMLSGIGDAVQAEVAQAVGQAVMMWERAKAEQ